MYLPLYPESLRTYEARALPHQGLRGNLRVFQCATTKCVLGFRNGSVFSGESGFTFSRTKRLKLALIFHTELLFILFLLLKLALFLHPI